MAKYFFIIFILIAVSVSVFYGLVYQSEIASSVGVFGKKQPKANNWGGPPIRTALHEAVFNKTYSEIEEMLTLGANVNAIDENGQTPLHFAAFFGRLDITKLLVEYGSDVNRQDNFNWKPLDLVVEKPENEDLLDYLEDITDK